MSLLFRNENGDDDVEDVGYRMPGSRVMTLYSERRDSERGKRIASRMGDVRDRESMMQDVLVYQFSLEDISTRLATRGNDVRQGSAGAFQGCLVCQPLQFATRYFHAVSGELQACACGSGMYP